MYMYVCMYDIYNIYLYIYIYIYIYIYTVPYSPSPSKSTSLALLSCREECASIRTTLVPELHSCRNHRHSSGASRS